MPDSQKIFDPRPEAQATTWDALMPPVQMAVHDLLVRIYGAHHSVRDKNTGKYANSSMQQTGNCFLVYGSRGTGKTTVLLNAQRAVCRKEGKGFFPEIVEQKKNIDAKETPENKARKETQENAEKLRKDGIIWLEILNLEPIPSEANLLTVLLTQVRNALHSHCDKRQREQRSVFEEEANSAQQQLNRLIGETTLMWQNIIEPDTRNISARQVKAADIYAGFQKKFNEAMDNLIDELSDTRGSDSKVSIVLPIDNIDRSTEHLQSIVKLAQLVSHPNLWLVMAGDRVEVETFLERGYWKELIRSSDGAGARGKIDSDGEDEALVMARRQANATAQKLWPANHRVEIDFLKPDDTLAFEYKQNSTVAPNTERTLNLARSLDIKTPCSEYEEHLRFSCKCYSAVSKTTIRDLLAKIPIPTTDDQRKRNAGSSINLLNLFYVEKEVTGKVVDEIRPEYLTRAAYHGLSLPARSVLDLWQLLDWLVHDVSSSGNDFKAEKVARTMLRNAIASSTMSNAIAQHFQNNILRRGENRGSVLFFLDTPLEIFTMYLVNRDFDFALRPVISNSQLPDHRLCSQLAINDIEDIALHLQQKKSEKTKSSPIELQPLVAAWLMALYDVLILAEASIGSCVIGSAEIKWFNVSVRHTIVSPTEKYKKREEKLYWKAPDWRVFWGRNIFRLRWKNFREEIVQSPSKDQPKNQIHVIRLLAAGWIFCVLKTSFELISSIDTQFITSQESNNPELRQLAKGFEANLDKAQDFLDIVNFEKNLMHVVEQFYQLIQYSKNHPLILNNSDNQPVKSIISAAYEVMLAAGEWLEKELIYFLSYACVPIESSEKRFTTMWNDLENSKSGLQKYWQDNLPFILAEQEEKLAKVENKSKDEKSEDVKNNGDNQTTKLLGEILFADLYKKLRELEISKPSSGQ